MCCCSKQPVRGEKTSDPRTGCVGDYPKSSRALYRSRDSLGVNKRGFLPVHAWTVQHAVAYFHGRILRGGAHSPEIVLYLLHFPMMDQSYVKGAHRKP